MFHKRLKEFAFLRNNKEAIIIGPGQRGQWEGWITDTIISWETNQNAPTYYCHGIQVSLAFQNFALHHFAFAKDLCSYLCLPTGRNPKSIFAFTKKAEIELRGDFAVSHYKGNCPLPQPSHKPGTAELLPGESHSAPRLQAGHCSTELCPGAPLLYLRLFCAPISKTFPKVSEKPKKGYFWGLEMLKYFFFHINEWSPVLCFMPFCSWNAPLSDTGETVQGFWSVSADVSWASLAVPCLSSARVFFS